MKRKTLTFAIALGILFDVLFWKKTQGISYFIFVLILIGFAFIVIRDFKLKPERKGYLFLIPIGFFAVMSFIRAEPTVSFLNRAISLLLLGIWSVQFLGGEWVRFGLIDYLISGLGLSWNMLSLPLLRVDHLQLFPENENGEKGKFKPVIRGIFIAIPILLIFILLFSSADLAFAESIENLLDYFEIENIDEYIGRMILIFLAANAFLGLMFTAVKKSKLENFIGEEKPFVTPFLGSIEAGIVLVSVLLLYSTFIILQFRYFFFNQSAISELGITYSEYARRGFGELIAASVASLGLILILNTLTSIESKATARTLSWFYTGLILCNLIILVSASMRLSLYESAYGFTRLRMVSHVFIIWLGVLLAAVGGLVWKQIIRQFVNAFLLTTIGFAATLNAANIDTFIVKRNIDRTASGEALDSAYLANLSSDAIPALIGAFNTQDYSSEKTSEIGTAIYCYSLINQDRLENKDWQSWTISKSRARDLLSETESSLKTYQVIEEDWYHLIIDENGKEAECYPEYWID